jgi:hypothetical protein
MKRNPALLLALSAAVALAPSPSRATAENPNVYPFGEREALVGNAGVAGGTSTGAVYYNPAALSRLGQGRLSVSGSTYLQLNTHADRYAVIEDTASPYDSSGFETIPSTVISIFPGERWTFATFVLVPESSRLQNQQVFESPNVRLTVADVENTSDLWLGGSASFWVDDRWSLGASLYGVQHKIFGQQTAVGYFPTAPSDAGVMQVGSVQASTIGVGVILGALCVVEPGRQLGLRVQLPVLRLGGSASGYGAAMNYTNPTFASNEINVRDVRAEYQTPWDVTLGYRTQATSSLTFVADVGLQLGTEYDLFPDSALSTITKLDPTPRLGAGAELTVSPTLTLGLGALFNPSARHGLDSRDEASFRQDVWGLTGGAYLGGGRIRTGLGLFALFGKGEVIPYNDPNNPSPLSRRAYGASLTFTYFLGESAAPAS